MTDLPVLERRAANDPRGSLWDHKARCTPHDEARTRCDQLKRDRGFKAKDGSRIRWRVRECRGCGGFYVLSERRS